MNQGVGLRNNIFCMNTIISFLVYGKRADRAMKRMKNELYDLEKKLSRFIENSEVSRMNQSAGKAFVAISPETYEILSKAILMSEISEGRFDITVSPMIDLWDYQHFVNIPEERKIRSTLAMVDYRDIILKPKEKKAALRKEGQSIDLGGIGKGYASDQCVRTLQKNGISSAFINIGGNVSTLGNKPDSSPWNVGIRHPRKENSLLGVVKVTNKAVVTSGDYERYFIDAEGNRRHHILNPTTGYPVDAGLISVTVIYDNAIIGDALSTAIFASGAEKGMKYLAHFPGAEAILVDNLQQVYVTQGIQESFKATEGVEVSVIRKEQEV